MRANLFCLVPHIVLRVSPYSLSKGALVKAEVQALNAKGWSGLSTLNTAGAVIETEPDAPGAPSRVEATTDETQVTVSFPALAAGSASGGPTATIATYELQWVAGATGGTWTTQSGVSPLSLATTRTATPVTPGQVYRFRVRAKNEHGWGPPGAETSVYAADIPDVPSAPLTARSGTNIRISWTAPNAHGLTIDEYEILILQGDGTTWSASASCAGNSATIVANRYCDVPMSELRGAPWSLVLNSVVKAKFRARNLLGWSSAYSPETVAGASMPTAPLAPPTAPTEDILTDDTQLVVRWAALTGDYSGQDTITGYQVAWDGGSAGLATTDVWPFLKAESAGSFTYVHTQTTSITPGQTYRVRYRASNQPGMGDWSPILSITASAAPLAPAPMVTVNNGLNVGVSWSAPTSDRGAAITSYEVRFKRSDGTYSSILPACDGSTLVATRACTVPMSTLTASPYSLAVGNLIVASVRATNNKGTSPWSTDNTAGALAETAPTTAPTPLKGAGTTSGQIQVTWTALTTSPSNGGSAVTSYRVYVTAADVTGTPTTLVANVAAASSLSITHSSLTVGAKYGYAIRAVNLHGEGAYGPTTYIYAAGTPGAPTGLTL